MAPSTRNTAPGLSDLVMQLEDYNPTIPDAVTAHYLNTAGFESGDGRLVRLVSLAAQKFISDIATDALSHARVRSNASGAPKQPPQGGKGSGKDKRYTMTMEDLAPVLAEYGVTVKKPHYYV